MPTKFYEQPTDDAERPKRFCDGLREDLKYCLINSDCVQKVGCQVLRTNLCFTMSSIQEPVLEYWTFPCGFPYGKVHNYGTGKLSLRICACT